MCQFKTELLIDFCVFGARYNSCTNCSSSCQYYHIDSGRHFNLPFKQYGEFVFKVIKQEQKGICRSLIGLKKVRRAIYQMYVIKRYQNKNFYRILSNDIHAKYSQVLFLFEYVASIIFQFHITMYRNYTTLRNV